MRQTNRPLFRFSISVLLCVAALAVAKPASAACIDTNTCLGTGALQINIDGVDNSALGYRALAADEHGSQNTAVGANALANNKGDGETQCDQSWCEGATANTAVGFGALSRNTSASGNTATGHRSLWLSSSGKFNVADGVSALKNNATGSQNSAVGAFALESNQTGGSNTAMGFEALGASVEGGSNTAMGAAALKGFNWDGADRYRQLGSFNASVGALAMNQNDTGDYNAALGYRALGGSAFDGMTGDSNTAIGAQALRSNSSGSDNTASGFDSLHANSTGVRNTAHGFNALGSVTTGVRNTAIGAAAGKNVITGSDNIIIGAENQGRAAENGVIRIGQDAFQKKTFVAGVNGVKTGRSSATAVFIDANGQLGTIKSSLAVKEDIHPLADASERLYSLRPVSFRYKEPFDDGSKPVQYGLVAEEVAATFPELVVYDAEGAPATVSYHVLPTLLLNEVQKGRRLADAQAQRIAELEKQAADVIQLRLEVARMAETIARLDHDAHPQDR